VSDTFDMSLAPIEGDRIRLRKLTLDDARSVYAFASDPEVAEFTLWRPHPTEEYTRGFLKILLQPSMLSWAIVLKEERIVVGTVFLHSLNKQHQKAELAFNVMRSHWKKGLATEAARAVLSFAFKQLRLNRVEATCMPGNHGSRRVLEKIGMSKEGTMRKSHRRYDGYHDMELFSILTNYQRSDSSHSTK
jgi:[ribosomal protein S5]-alanine N-acetyltransferase